MAYIGKQPVIGNFVKLDAISVVNGQAAYTMNNGGSAFTDYENVNQFLVSLNGILQSPTTSFTVSGSTLTFASNLATGDVIDFVIVLGNTLDIGTPSDNTVSLAKLTATGTKDATTFLRGDNTFAEAGGGGILQVKSATKTDTQTFSAATLRADITGLSVTLTPSSTSNKVLVRFMVTHWGNDSHCQIERSIGGGSYSIISAPTVTGSRIPTHSGGSHRNINELNTATMEVLDDPNTTSSITYKMTFNNGAAAGGTGYINRPSDDADSANTERGISTITAMEIDSGVL